MAPGENLALVASTGEEETAQAIPMITDCHEEVKHDFNDHMAFAARTFWKNPSKAKEQNYQRNSTSSFKGIGLRPRTCYNCQDKLHFVAECPYEPREEHGGRLILKSKTKEIKETKEAKAPFKKQFIKNKKGSTSRKSGRMVLIAQEEYTSGEENDEEEETTPCNIPKFENK